MMPSVGNLLALLLLSFPVSALAQTPETQVPTPHPPHIARRGTPHPHPEPCWKQAGVSKGAIEQRRSLQQTARSEVESVCANSSLTQQQRHQQIRAIRERTRQQLDSLISPQQREAIRTCEEARNGGHRGEGGGLHAGGGRGEGPCAEFPESKEATPDREP